MNSVTRLREMFKPYFASVEHIERLEAKVAILQAGLGDLQAGMEPPTTGEIVPAQASVLSAIDHLCRRLDAVEAALENTREEK